MTFDFLKSKYNIVITSRFKKDYKKIIKQNKDKNKLIYILKKLANGEMLEAKYKDHGLINNKLYKDCRECHIEPDWLLVYRYHRDELVLLLVATGSHSELFDL